MFPIELSRASTFRYVSLRPTADSVDVFDRWLRGMERIAKVQRKAASSASAPVFLQRARGRLPVAVRGTIQHTRLAVIGSNEHRIDGQCGDHDDGQRGDE